VSAQDALVLSGGGSRGLAHVGALLGLQRRGHAPGLVVGTSVGAVIGALYAAGFTPDSIAQLTSDEDWVRAFSPVEWVLGPDRSPLQPVLDLRLGGGDAATATGLVSDLRVNRRLVQLLFDASARAGGDFDKLPRRYRAIAADLTSGAAVVLGAGDLARAVRASMSVPGAFAPVLLDGRVLVDGGIANYLPLTIARDLGALRVFAVDVLRPPPELRSTSPITLAYRGFRTVLVNTLDPSAVADYLILPTVPQGLSAAYFPRSPDALFNAGRAAALATVSDTTTPLSLPLHWATPPDSLSALVIESSAPAIAALARNAFRGVAPGSYDPRVVFAAADRLYASGFIRGVWPRVEVGSDAARPRLVVHVDPGPPTRFAVAAAYDTDRGGRIWSAARHRLGSLPVELIASGSLGSIDRLATLETRGVFNAAPALSWTVGAVYRESDLRLFEGERRMGERELTRAGAWAGLDWRSVARELHGSLTLRGDRVHDSGGPDGVTVGPSLSLRTTGNGSRVVGLPLRVEAETRFGELEYQRVRLAGSLDAQSRRWRFAAVADIAAAHGDAPLDVLPALGDDHAVPGLPWGRERQRTRAIAGVDVAYPIFLDGYLRLEVRGGFAADRLQSWNDVPWTLGTGLTGVWLTPLGAVQLGTAASEHGDWRIHFGIGPRF
jgi:predicted acylesterase/phospholipase RssA